MFFDSPAYFLFVPVIWLVYQVTPDARRWLVLLVASVLFYATLKAPVLLAAWAGVTWVSYECGLRMARQTAETARGRLLWAGIAANVGVLCGVKYLHTLAQAFYPSLAADTAWGNLFVTIGVSYYTLQAVSYLTDVYMETAEPETHFGRFALYLGFFPKLLQGPIERASDLMPQLRTPYERNTDNLYSGLILFGWGLFKKEAVANRLAVYVDAVYGDVSAHDGVTLVWATYLYAIQIFADFSGYTDMALGVAQMFNIRLTQNFNSPYLAASVPDFWRRWHISFSRWILDYIFKPLQIQWRDGRNFGVAAALMVTFLFSGLWHGFAWTFIVWGALHGLYLAASVFWKPWQTRIFGNAGPQTHPVRRAAQVFVTFNLVAFAWIFFRANSMSDALTVLSRLTTGWSALTDPSALAPALLLGRAAQSVLTALGMIAVLIGGDLLQNRWGLDVRFAQQKIWVRWVWIYLLAFAIIFFGMFTKQQFIYFQF